MYFVCTHFYTLLCTYFALSKSAYNLFALLTLLPLTLTLTLNLLPLALLPLTLLALLCCYLLCYYLLCFSYLIQCYRQHPSLRDTFAALCAYVISHSHGCVF